ncbi:MAG: hypothetical protein P4L83_04425 [Nevskia sp.]|nr:hypothetical protein [Nevskia sp.]
MNAPRVTCSRLIDSVGALDENGGWVEPLPALRVLAAGGGSGPGSDSRSAVVILSTTGSASFAGPGSVDEAFGSKLRMLDSA